MTTRIDFENAADALVYVRPVAVDDLPDALRIEAEEGGLDVIYALHRADGAQVALVGNRSMAFHLARENDLTAVSVH